MPQSNEQTIPAHKRLDKGDLFWLSYLIFFLIEPLGHSSWRLWVEAIAGIAIFTSMYVLFLKRCALRLRLTLLAAMELLGLLTYPTNVGATTFMVYAAALLPFVLSRTSLVIAVQVAQCAVLMLEGWLLHITPWSWGSGALLMLTVGGSNVGFAQKARADRRLRLQAEEIEALAALAERERIARDLHDVLGHTLSVIVLKAELAGRLLENGANAEHSQRFPALDRAAAEIADVQRTARSALAEVREAIGGYRSRGLRAEVEAARGTLASAGVTLVAEGELAATLLSAAEETVLALALREAVTNIVRHARASRCTLRMVQAQGRFELSIQDNGQASESSIEGNGLRGMRERIEALGGKLSRTSEAGTKLLVDLPVTG